MQNAACIIKLSLVSSSQQKPTAKLIYFVKCLYCSPKTFKSVIITVDVAIHKEKSS